MNRKKTKIGIVGTGFIAKGLCHLIVSSPDFSVGKVLTRRPIASVKDLPPQYLTHSTQALIDHSDIIFECSGDVVHATEVIMAATNAKKKVVTLNAEFHVTTGSYFIQEGHYVSETDGDQPGCLARLKDEILGMGFKPLAYVNIKGYLNHNPSREDMAYWAQQQGISLAQTTSFTDGTKLEIEQALVANGLGATIAQGGMLGKTIESLNEVDFLIHAAKQAQQPVSDYILCKGAPPGVMIVAENPHADRLGNYIIGPMRTKEKLGYVMLRPYHLCHLEALNTLRKIVAGEGMLMHNSAQPSFTVAAIAKRKIKKGELIERGAGGFDVRGIAVPFKENTSAVPICLLQNTPVLRDIEPGQTLQFEDIDLTHSLALEIYQTLIPSTKPTTLVNQTYDLSWLTQTISAPAPSPKTRPKEKVPLA